MIEPVSGRIILRNLEDVAAILVSALDGAGRPFGAAALATRTADGWEIAIGDPATTWYEIIV